MGTLSSKTALGTGSGRGIGKAIAERFGKLGANVIVNYSASKQAALATVEAIEKNGVRAIAIQADLAKVEEIHRLFARSMEHFGRLDIVVAMRASNSLTRQWLTSRKRTSIASLRQHEGRILHPAGGCEARGRQRPHHLCGIKQHQVFKARIRALWWK